jgi:hypothetical protein
MIPTPVDFIKLVLFYVNYSADFTEIIAKSADQCFVAMTLYDAAVTFLPSTISLAALMVVLEKMNFLVFQQELISTIVQKRLAFNLNDVYRCQQMIEDYNLQLTQPADETQDPAGNSNLANEGSSSST